VFEATQRKVEAFTHYFPSPNPVEYQNINNLDEPAAKSATSMNNSLQKPLRKADC
jgi:hypothetical protein